MTTRNQQLLETIVVALVESFLFLIIVGVVTSIFFVPTIGGAVFLTVLAIVLSKIWWKVVSENLLQP